MNRSNIVNQNSTWVRFFQYSFSKVYHIEPPIPYQWYNDCRETVEKKELLSETKSIFHYNSTIDLKSGEKRWELCQKWSELSWTEPNTSESKWIEWNRAEQNEDNNWTTTHPLSWITRFSASVILSLFLSELLRNIYHNRRIPADIAIKTSSSNREMLWNAFKMIFLKSLHRI